MVPEPYPEPASRFLPSEEEWHPRTWRQFRFAVLQRIHDSGAHSIAEICRSPPQLLFLPLNRAEIHASLDSARRRGLVVPLHPHPGSISKDDEWILTDQGRRTIRNGLPWLMDQLGGLPKYLSAIVALVGSLSFGKWIESHNGWDLAAVAGTIASLLVTVGSVLLIIRSQGAGAAIGRTVARDWRRWARERPEWYDRATAPFPWLWLLATLAYFFGSAYLLTPLVGNSTLLLALVAFPALALLIPVFTWYFRWGIIGEEAAKMEKERKGGTPSRRKQLSQPKPPAPGGTMITKTDFIGVPSQDAERARSFYVETLGLRPDEHSRFECWAGDTCFGIWEPEKQGMKFAPAKNAHPALHVDDVEAARKELEAKGVEFAGETFDTGVCHMALFTDPDGNDLMLHNRYAPYES